MKKLMIAAAMVAVAFGMQAATLDWGVLSVSNPASGETAPDGWVAYVFAVDATAKSGNETFTTRAAVISALQDGLGKDLSKVTALASSDGSAATSEGMVVAFGGTSDVFSNGSESTDNTVTAFAVIFNSDDISKATLAYVTDTADGYIDSYGSMSEMLVFDATSSTGASNWISATPAPEPTSGLLLLLGMGALALRRRRA